MRMCCFSREPIRISPSMSAGTLTIAACTHARCEATAVTVIVILDFRRLTSTEVRYVKTVTN